MKREIYALGIGISSPVIMELAMDCGYEIAGLYHYNCERTGQYDHGYEILGSFEDMLNTDIKGKNFLLTMGNMQIRKQLTEQILEKGGNLPTLIHPSAQVSRFAEISSIGVQIAPNCIVQADVKMRNGVVMRDGAIICHTTEIGSHVFIGPQALVGALITVNNGTFIGQKSLLISGKVKSVGENSTIGAGSVVTKPVEDNTIVVGNPAKPLDIKK